MADAVNRNVGWRNIGPPWVVPETTDETTAVSSAAGGRRRRLPGMRGRGRGNGRARRLRLVIALIVFQFPNDTEELAAAERLIGRARREHALVYELAHGVPRRRAEDVQHPAAL